RCAGSPGEVPLTFPPGPGIIRPTQVRFLPPLATESPMRTRGWILVVTASLIAAPAVSAQQPVIVSDHAGATITFLPTKPWKIKASDFQDVYIVVQQTKTGSLLFGAGVNSDAGLS